MMRWPARSTRPSAGSPSGPVRGVQPRRRRPAGRYGSPAGQVPLPDRVRGDRRGPPRDRRRPRAAPASLLARPPHLKGRSIELRWRWRGEQPLPASTAKPSSRPVTISASDTDPTWAATSSMASGPGAPSTRPGRNRALTSRRRPHRPALLHSSWLPATTETTQRAPFPACKEHKVTSGVTIRRCWTLPGVV